MATIDLGRVMPIYRGEYSAATQYELNDVVLHTDGNLYWHHSDTPTTGTAPTNTTYWTLAFSGSSVHDAIEAMVEDAEAWAVGQRDGVDVEDTDPTYHNNAKYYAGAASGSAEAASDSATAAGNSATAADSSAETSEAYAIGKRDGVDVSSADPAYHNNSKYYSERSADSATAAAGSATNAGTSEDNAEAWATGKKNGVDVGSSDPAYHNNSKYYSEQAADSASSAASAAETAVNTHNVDATAHANLYVRAGKKANTTLGSRATAEGQNTTASATNSHAEGGGTTASGLASHAEGGTTVASGDFSHAEGNYTAAIGSYSHAEGNYTVASHRSQHVFGEYNKNDTSQASSTSKGTYIEIVGNGANDNNRRNARTLDWAGNEVLAGSLQTGSSIVAGGRVTVGLGPSGDMDAATKGYVDAADSAINIRDLLTMEAIPDTSQQIIFASGTQTLDRIYHTRTSDSQVMRTDVFTFASGSVTEVRTLDTGDSLTIVTNLTTLVTTITFTPAA